MRCYKSSPQASKRTGKRTSTAVLRTRRSNSTPQQAGPRCEGVCWKNKTSSTLASKGWSIGSAQAATISSRGFPAGPISRAASLPPSCTCGRSCAKAICRRNAHSSRAGTQCVRQRRRLGARHLRHLRRVRRVRRATGGPRVRLPIQVSKALALALAMSQAKAVGTIGARAVLTARATAKAWTEAGTSVGT